MHAALYIVHAGSEYKPEDADNKYYCFFSFCI